jgi:hypothetical protein
MGFVRNGSANSQKKRTQTASIQTVGDPARKRTLKDEITAWREQRNNRDTSVNWQFTTDDARIKLNQLYSVSEKD